MPQATIQSHNSFGQQNGNNQYIHWLAVSIPLKNTKVSWDDDIPNIWKNKSHVPNHQPDIFNIVMYLAYLILIGCHVPPMLLLLKTPPAPPLHAGPYRGCVRAPRRQWWGNRGSF
jgi:hypothetical protein